MLRVVVTIPGIAAFPATIPATFDRRSLAPLLQKTFQLYAISRNLTTVVHHQEVSLTQRDFLGRAPQTIFWVTTTLGRPDVFWTTLPIPSLARFPTEPPLRSV